MNLAGVSTPLAASLNEGHEAVATELLARGARVEGDSLRQAARNGSLRLVKKVLDAGGVINPKASKAPTALHAAVERKGAVGLQLTRFLIAAGANLNARTGATLGGKTPLHWAAMAKNKKAIELLLKAGADRRVRDSNGRTFDFTG